MEEFVHQQNLEHYRKLLGITTDEAERRILLKLLADEEAQETRNQNRGAAERAAGPE